MTLYLNIGHFNFNPLLESKGIIVHSIFNPMLYFSYKPLSRFCRCLFDSFIKTMFIRCFFNLCLMFYFINYPHNTLPNERKSQ